MHTTVLTGTILLVSFIVFHLSLAATSFKFFDITDFIEDTFEVMAGPQAAMGLSHNGPGTHIRAQPIRAQGARPMRARPTRARPTRAQGPIRARHTRARPIRAQPTRAQGPTR